MDKLNAKLEYLDRLIKVNDHCKINKEFEEANTRITKVCDSIEKDLSLSNG